MFRRKIVKKSRSGRYQLQLGDDERQLLGSLLPQLREIIESDDPSARRLFPTAYTDDPDRELEYQILARSELVDKRMAALEVVAETLEATELTEAEIAAWMGAINDIRLVLGTRLDVSEDDEPADPDDPAAAAHALYWYLGWLLENLVEAMSRSLPDGDDSTAPA